MSRSGSDHLYRLIGSLSRSEKGYFKKYSQLYSSDRANSYLRLFEAMARQKAYDEAKLQKQLQLSPRQFATQKNYLYKQLLRSLDAYQSGTSPYLDLTEGLRQAQILRDKGFTLEALRQTKRLRKRAEELGHWDLLLLILDHEREMLLALEGNSSDLQELENRRIPTQHKQILSRKCQDLLHTVNQVWQKDLFFRELSQFASPVQDLLTEIRSAGHPLFQLWEKMLLALEAPQKLPELFPLFLKELEQSPANPELRWQGTFLFLRLAKAYSPQSLPELLQKGITYLPEQQSAREYWAYFQASPTEITPSSETGSALLLAFAQAGQLLLNKSEASIQTLLNPILEAKGNGPHSDLYPAASLLSLADFLQKGENLFLEYRVRAVIRELKSNGHLDQASRIVLRFLDRASRFAHTPQVHSAAQKALQQLSGKEDLLDYFDFRQWIQQYSQT